MRKAILPLGLDIARNRRIIVPKTLILASEGSSEVLFTSCEHEKYNAGFINKSIGARLDAKVSHKRETDSVVLPNETLKRFTRIIISDELYRISDHENALLVYPAGKGNFFCFRGRPFLKTFSTLPNVRIEYDIE